MRILKAIEAAAAPDFARYDGMVDGAAQSKFLDLLKSMLANQQHLEKQYGWASEQGNADEEVVEHCRLDCVVNI